MKKVWKAFLYLLVVATYFGVVMGVAIVGGHFIDQWVPDQTVARFFKGWFFVSECILFLVLFIALLLDDD